MVARCSTDAATVFDDLRQAVRNIAFRSDPTLGEIVKPLSPGCSNPARKASPPVPGHHHSCEIGKSAFDQRRHLRSHHRHQELRSSGCYIAVTTLIAALLQRFVSLRSGSIIPRSTIPIVWAARKMSVALSAARLALFNRSVPDNIALADPAMPIERNKCAPARKQGGSKK
jgi:hypothetical protein